MARKLIVASRVARATEASVATVLCAIFASGCSELRSPLVAPEGPADVVATLSEAPVEPVATPPEAVERELPPARGRGTSIGIRCADIHCAAGLPAVIIDGVLRDNWPPALEWRDIDHFEIFKGQAAVFLFGEVGANGVIEITTKAGARDR